MANNRQRERELARRRYERQQQRRAATARRRRKLTIVVAGIVVVVLAVSAGVIALVAGGGKAKPASLAAAKPSTAASATASASASASPSPSVNPTSSAGLPLACYQKAPPTQPPVQKFAAAPPQTIDTSKTYSMTIDTTCGIIPIALDAAKAPVTVNSFAFLASKGYFTNTECHRVTTSTALTVLQCGDPTATGSGSPGYTFKDENLAGATYPRGTLAMANSGANTNGSQFFLVDKDSQLPASYTPFGTISAAGLKVLDKIIGHGVAGGGTDGRPAQRIFIKTLKVTAA